MIKVLLISPTDPTKPVNLKYLVGGENTYTKTLIKNPPTGIIYIHHLDAIKRGMISYLTLYKVLSILVKLRILPISSGTQAIAIHKNFDLIHCHGYSVKIKGSNAPVVLSDSSSNYLFLNEYLGWPKWRIKAGYLLRRWLFNLLGVIDPDTNSERAKKLIVFSEFARKIHEKRDVLKDKVEIVYPGLPSKIPTTPKPDTVSGKYYDKGSELINILFVGTWFERKGGPMVLQAFEKLAKKYPNIRLTVVGQIPKKFQISNFKFQISFYDYVPRQKLLNDFFPNADIFVLVPPKVEGFGFAVLEAMSFGIPAVVTDVCALPELVENGKTGFIIKPGSLNELTEKLEVLVKNKKLRNKMGEAARKRFEERFSIQKSNEKLLKVYKEAIKSF